MSLKCAVCAYWDIVSSIIPVRAAVTCLNVVALNAVTSSVNLGKKIAVWSLAAWFVTNAAQISITNGVDCDE